VECSQMLGANGFLQSFPLERMIAYAKMSQIIDGTSQVQKIVIGRQIEREAMMLQEHKGAFDQRVLGEKSTMIWC
jgi:hypothetical protein